MLKPPNLVEEEDLFHAALVLPLPERERYLARACGRDLDRLKQLNALLDAFGAAEGFAMDRELAPECEEPKHIGPYCLVQELGEGGCGIVYLAEQTSPVRRQVAVKIVKPGMDTKAVVARFEAERQVLALLDHPNIAKVFDAGATAQGRPYFVMELVRGVRVTDYCAQCRLTIPERLSLFAQVCQAIQHAHQKGIIHRDIKPSNVMVTMHDGLPIAKVIDFGIAKATQGRVIDQTLHTEVDQLMGTPAYISPEQTQSIQAQIDTRSDIYSLGVLLYELLTTLTPFDAEELMEASLEQFRTRIRTEEPLRPSKRLRGMEQDMLAQVSECCATTCSKLPNQVQDDLDWIVMQCLEKEPDRRYQTVNELVADLERHLQCKPVRARPPSLLYSVRKLARRNKVAFASALAGSLFVLFVMAFAIIMAVQAERIATERDHVERERKRAEKTANVALNVFAVADPFQSYDKNISAPILLEQAVRSIKHELADQPVTKGRMLRAVGGAYVRRGEFKPAIAYLREAVGLLHGAHREQLTAIIDLCLALRVSGDLTGARRALADGERLATRLALERSPVYAKLLLNRGRIELAEGRISAAQAAHARSLQLFRETTGPKSIEVAEALTELGMTFVWTDDIERAEEFVREALVIFEVAVPEMHPDRVGAEVRLSEILYLQNKLDDAASILVVALRKNTELFGSQSSDVVDVLDRLAIVRYSQGRFAEAEKLSRDAVASCVTACGDSHATTASVSITLARTLFERRKYAEAERTLRQSLDLLAEALPADHQYVASAEFFLGQVLLATNNLGEAEAVLSSSMNRWMRTDAPPWRALRSANALGEAIYRQGRRSEGAKYLSDSFRELMADPKAEQSAKDKARERVSRYLGESAYLPHSKQPTI